MSEQGSEQFIGGEFIAFVCKGFIAMVSRMRRHRTKSGLYIGAKLSFKKINLIFGLKFTKKILFGIYFQLSISCDSTRNICHLR